MRGVLEIDLARIVHNWRALDALGPAETAATVKADAYGLGAGDVVPALSAVGARTFFVATVDEAVAIADRAPEAARIFVLDGYAPDDPVALALDARRISPVLSAPETASAWAAAAGRGRPARVALQLETGMNRLGLAADEIDVAIDAAAASGLEVDLVMSHLATADEPDHAQTAAQRAQFEALVRAKIKPALPTARLSLSATGGGVLGPNYAFDMVRAGVGLFGGLPFVDALPVVGLHAPLLRVWTVEAGETSGYGASWTAPRRTRLGVIPIGYADGAPRALSGRGLARIAGAEAPFVGRVSMDLIVVALDAAPNAQVGDTVRLLSLDPSDRLTIDAMASKADTIGYEVLTRLDAARRLERRTVGSDPRR